MQIGQNIIRLSSVDSTNNYTAKLQKEGIIKSGTVILAEDQFGGRGQRGSEWLSNAGENLTFSIFIAEVNLSVERQFRITQYVSVILIQFLKKKGIPCNIKWPNDIYYQDKKLAGLLIESSIQGSTINSVVIGIGLNVNQISFGSLPATSMSKALDSVLNLDSILMELIYEFNAKNLEGYLRASGGDEEYHNSLYGLNEKLRFEDQTGEFVGVIKGVTQLGKLSIEKEDSLEEYSLKEISFIG
jgi:BirA family biotin operon repressor/biotin-[acetyl-CoA-carboxylase] ligase